jgi:hypothetical protein
MYPDPFLPEECGRYAAEVCPFLAAPSYSVGAAGSAILAGRSSGTNPAYGLPTTPPTPIHADKNEFDVRVGGGLEWRPVQAVSVVALSCYQGANYGVAKSAVLLSLGELLSS